MPLSTAHLRFDQSSANTRSPNQAGPAAGSARQTGAPVPQRAQLQQPAQGSIARGMQNTAVQDGFDTGRAPNFAGGLDLLQAASIRYTASTADLDALAAQHYSRDWLVALLAISGGAQALRVLRQHSAHLLRLGYTPVELAGTVLLPEFQDRLSCLVRHTAALLSLQFERRHLLALVRHADSDEIFATLVRHAEELLAAGLRVQTVVDVAQEAGGLKKLLAVLTAAATAAPVPVKPEPIEAPTDVGPSDVRPNSTGQRVERSSMLRALSAPLVDLPARLYRQAPSVDLLGWAGQQRELAEADEALSVRGTPFSFWKWLTTNSTAVAANDNVDVSRAC